jgi:hypothetical protein
MADKIRASRAKGLLLTRFVVPPYQQLSQSLGQWGRVVMASGAEGYMMEVSVRAYRLKRPAEGKSEGQK